MTTPLELLSAVQDVARLAGDIALGHFRTTVAVETKRDGSPVTRADREAESAARAWIQARYPNDGIVGEELGIHNPEARRRWFIDPIDGTRSFIVGVPLWGTLVGVADGEDVLAGAIYCPAVNETVAAAIGAGCWWNGSRANVSSVDRLAQALVLTTDDAFRHAPTPNAHRAAWSALASAAATSRTWGDCYGYVLVATGRAEAMVDAIMSPWDAVALMPVITEAGGVFTDWSGRATAFGGSVIATNGVLSTTIRDALTSGPEADR